MKVQIIFLFSMFITGCTSQKEFYPEIELSDLDPSVIVALPLSGKYMEPFEVCKNPDVICMDPPPMLIRYKVLEHVYGQELPKYVNIKTTSHYGFSGYDFRNPYPELILVGTNGTENIVPRYHKMIVAQDYKEDFVMPIYSNDDIWWLPCDVSELIQKVRFHRSYDHLNIPIEDLLPEYEESGYNIITKHFIKPASGIYIGELKTFLNNNSKMKNMDSFDCARN